MPKRGAIALALTAFALALLLNFQTPVDVSNTATRTGGGSTASTAGGATAGGATAGGAAAGGTSAGTGAGSGADNASAAPSSTRTVDGSSVTTRFGTVQVEITVHGSQITDVSALQLPVGGRSGQISSYAAPVLRSWVLQAQSANIDVISGATYTSLAYARSVQSALDNAGI